MTEDRIVRIANGQGFWGDSMLGPLRLVEEGPLDYLTLDYLAEITMSIMQKLRSRNPDAGYATDFVEMLSRILPQCKAKGIKVIANAGGVNPRGCLAAIRQVAKDLNMNDVRIGIVEGDDIFHDIQSLMDAGESFTNMDTGEPLSAVRDKLTSANVYIGAQPIAEALDQGADIVITGRATDPSLVLGPLIHEFGWSMDDYDRLAHGTVMGHMLECGAQVTGGNYTGWRKVPDLARIGYPVTEAHADGHFVLTKHGGTGGLVNAETVSSQILYEMADPRKYLGPDCTADFTTINLTEEGENRVRVDGVKGAPPTDTYKVSMAYEDGYQIVGSLVVAAPDAIEKARLCADMVFKRLAMYGIDIPEEDRFVELFGTNVCYKGIVPSPEDPGEIMLRIGATGNERKQLEQLGRELAPLVLSGPPGLTGFAAGRPKPSSVYGYWPALMGKSRVTIRVTVEEA
jgi:hypothetical protein